FLVPRGGPALLERRPHAAGLHRALGRARAPAGRRGRARPRPPGAGPTARALAPPPGMGDAVGGDGEALRVALSSDGGPHQRAARRSRDQLARRPAPGAPGGHPRRRVAQHALRRAPLLRAPAHDSRGALRGGPGGRRRPAGDTRPSHAAAARSHRAAGAPLPDARRAARLRHDVRTHRRRPGGDHRDAHGLRLPRAHCRVVLEQSLIPRALVNSVGIATLTTLLALVLGVPGAYAIARLPLPGKSALLLAIVASTAFPQIATVSPLYLLMRALG